MKMIWNVSNEIRVECPKVFIFFEKANDRSVNAITNILDILYSTVTGRKLLLSIDLSFFFNWNNFSYLNVFRKLSIFE